MTEIQYRIVFYCPDTNFVYNGETPDVRGIGGGKTALIRLACAIAGLGHKVTCYVNCERPGLYSGVEYLHFKDVNRIACDVLIAMTSGGDLDLSSLAMIPVEARLRAVWIHGIPRLKGLEKVPYDFIYTPSHFIKEVVVKEWGLSADKTFVFPHGIEESNFLEAGHANIKRDPFAIVYFGHPSKGLDVVIEVVKALRQRDKRFHLDIYGGYELCGQPHQAIQEDEGIVFKGLVGQKELARQLFKYGFCLALQEIPEAFGLAVAEAKRAGVIVIASKVGAYAETISDGYDGFLIDEHYRSKECSQKVVELINNLVSDIAQSNFIRDNARVHVWTWYQVAQKFTEHWDSVLKRGRKKLGELPAN